MRINATCKVNEQGKVTITGTIPPAELVDHHPEIKAAIENYEAARDRELELRRAATQAEQELGRAEHLDSIALADAMERSAKDPGERHREAQLKVIADARRQHKASAIVLERAVDRVRAAFEEHGDEYEHSLHEEYETLREAMCAQLDSYADLLRQLRRNVSALRIAGGPVPSLDRVFFVGQKRPNGEDLWLSPEELLEKLRELGAGSEPAPRGSEHRLAPFQTPTVEPENGRPAAVMTAQCREDRLQRAAERAAARQALRDAEDQAIQAAG